MTLHLQWFLKRRTVNRHAWQSVDSDEGVPRAVANRVFGKDALTCRGVAQRRRKPINACPPKPWRRRKELNEVLVA